MKKLLMSTAAVVVLFCTATAQNQTTKVADRKQGQVCKTTGDGKTVKCYKTESAQNFKVCKSKKGYYTCGKKGNGTTAVVNTEILGIKQQPVLVTSTRSATGQVCKPSKKTGKAECYTTKYNNNLRVCREERGYYICGKTPNRYNSTFQFFNFKEDEDNYPYMPEYQYKPIEKSENTGEQKAPENQSYKNINLSTASR